MIVCRICLAENVFRDAYRLQQVIDKNVSHTDIIFFCLNIQITNNSKASKLCLKCYKKIIAFYKFKLLALENDKYFQSLENNDECEVFVPIKDIKEETEQINDQQEGQIQITDEPENIKQEVGGNPEIKEEHEWIDDYIKSDGELHNTKPKQKKLVKKAKEKLSEGAVSKRKRSHKKKEDGEKLKICEECGKAVRDIEAHMEVHKPSSERKTIPCKKCDKVFLTYAARYLHNKYKHEGIKEICTICNKSVSVIKSHMKAMHQPDELKYPCQSCDKRFLSATKLELHTRQHTQDRPFECDVCQGTFLSKVGLSLHIRSVHKKERQQHCHVCSKSFFKKYHLQMHLRTHTKEKPHKCGECNKSFMTAHCLKIHHKRHAGIKDVPCVFCDMKFISVREMKVHLVTHTKEKKHACQYCDVKFYRSDHRRNHERRAHLKQMQNSTAKVLVYS